MILPVLMMLLRGETLHTNDLEPFASINIVEAYHGDDILLA